MKKKLAGLLVAGVAVFALSGCGSSGGTVIVDPGPEEVTLFLVDKFDIGIEYVPYVCYSPDGIIVADTMTDFDGEFTFVPGDRCEFDFYSFPGSYNLPIYIVDIDYFGKDDIPYYCDNGIEFTETVTDFDGYFDYPEDSICKFYL